MSDQFTDAEVLTIKNLFYNILEIKADIKILNTPLRGDFLFYKRLNMLLPRFPSAEIKRFILAQNTQKRFYNRTAGRMASIIYANTMGLLASKSVAINGFDPEDNNALILLRKNSIRYFDFSSGHVTCVNKEGLPNHRIINEVSLRKKYHYTFLLELLDSGENWFRESIMSGRSLSQVRNKYVYKTAANKAVHHLKEIITDTITYREPLDYTAELREKIEGSLSILETYESININELRSTIYKLCLIAEKSDQMIPVALSHGDLHASNIWIDNRQNIYLIDWETIAHRSIWYDPATLLLKFRRSGMWQSMLENYDSPDIYDAVLVNDEQKNYPMESVIAILLLEYMNEVCQLLSDNTDAIQWKEHYVESLKIMGRVFK